MNKKAIGIFAALICIASASQAQYVEDALRFSQPENGSTSRFKAMGNVGTALGGDLSSITGNPAGLGFFNTNDAGFTLGYLNDKNSSNYYGTTTSSSIDKFALTQGGVVFNMPVHNYGNRRPSGWLNFNLGIGYARTNNFNTTINFMSLDDGSQGNSYTDFLTESANDPNADPIFGDWGFDGFLVDKDANGYYRATSDKMPNYQTNNDIQTGSQYQTNFSFGANYNNSFYIGGSIGVAGFNYHSNRKYDESGDIKQASEFEAGSEFLDPDNAGLLGAPYDLRFTSLQKTNGTGYNGTLGVIFRPDRTFQVGLSATSPTWYNVTDDYSMTFDSWLGPLNSTPIVEHHPAEEIYYDEYDLRTPYRLNAGVAAILSEGLISADIEFVDYSSMKITSNNHNNDLESADIISEDYQGAVNFKLGGEYKFSPELLLRAGYNYRGNPYKNMSSTKQTVSAGLGYRINNMYLDLTYANEEYDMTYTPYQSELYPAEAAIKNTRNNVQLTVGFKF